MREDSGGNMSEITLEPDRGPSQRILFLRHSAVVRVMHWVNFATLCIMLMSGLQIFNAHPSLYWGQSSNFSHRLLRMEAVDRADGSTEGVTVVGGRWFVTTGLFGWSRGSDGNYTARGFPDWATLPSSTWLAMGRLWHLFFAWVLVINGVAYVAIGIASGHLRRDLLPTRADLRALGHTLVEHARLRFPKGEAARHYNGIQKLAYLFIVFVVGPVMVLSGLAMSPTMDAGYPWLLTLFDGRQSARTVHFLGAATLLAFFLVHVAMVVVSGLGNNLTSMITGRYAIATGAPVRPAADASGREHE